ncbi:DNA mismatch repair protein MutS [Clostridiaceae bacterium JG1575]|nr:DNA mismatch repair protein MutS [Clostridiaceae bacterium JG1575]
MALTPMMQQYFTLKEAYPDCILFFRLGDFYEMFFEDAKIASRELELVLTGRDCGLEERAPMCGIPYHAAKNYIGRMVEKGYHIAICEQVEDPSLAKGIVRREVVQVITPGTLLDETFLKEDTNHYLMALLAQDKPPFTLSLAITDITTGDFTTTSFAYDEELLRGEIAKYDPREFLVFQQDALCEFLAAQTGITPTLKPELLPDEDHLELLPEFQQVEGTIPSTGKACVLGLLAYLKDTQKSSLTHIDTLRAYEVFDTMALDVHTRRNLELTENIVDHGKKGSLLWILDQTVTPMGARCLRRWVEKPLIRKKEIEERLDAVDALYEELASLGEIRDLLKGVYDLERMGGKVAQHTINPREMLSLKKSLDQVPPLKKALAPFNYGALGELQEALDALPDLSALIGRAIHEEPPILIKEGGLIRPGFSKAVDEFRDIKQNGKQWIAAMEQKERKETGISSLKVGFNKVFGYYIEVSRANLGKLPEGRYLRKQTLANAERFITEELKEMEEKILTAEDQLKDLEYALYTEVRNEVEGQVHRMKKTAEAMAALDCLAALAKVARDRDYCRPLLQEDGVVDIKEGRHPVVEAMIPRGEFIANDTYLDQKNQTFLILTGPNMAGKSTYMRQVALITLMAQLGSFVPARKATIGITDRIFTRIGASDDLAGGKSTFMVEMTEVSNILKNATKDSLILLDEVGRGTSTYDGMAIAWAVTEHLMGEEGIRARTLFATHYHELIPLDKRLPGVKNFSVAVKQVGQSIVFLRKIVAGGADESYGVEVARLAGLPTPVIARAREILLGLEQAGSKKRIKERQEKVHQLNFMDLFPKEEGPMEAVAEKIKALDLNAMSPMQAMMTLYDYQTQLKGE